MRRAQRQYTSDDDRWSAVLMRDAAADGKFFYSVKTTGIYCRPSCTARRPARENVLFHLSREEAERAGFRACKRCQPNGLPLTVEHARKVARACRAIEGAETPPGLAELAKLTGMSRFHFHRTFTQVTGLTPKAFAQGCRAERARRELSGSRSVTDAIYEAGFNSNGRFYAESPRILGMKPDAYRRGGAGEVIQFAIRPCSLGFVLVAASQKGVCAIFLADDGDRLVAELKGRFPKAHLVRGPRQFESTVRAVVGLVETPKRSLDLPLDVRGTAFQQRVWRALRSIPAGATASYAEIASRIGAPKAVRAVAGACASNLLAVAIPCHRVLRANGELSGYRWGTARKRALLAREK
ncbi:MAG: bifunctional DNA-binding transcriptional regulator/O6-methylguanine-DNA methyltransferase Ada [Limisphaerales bacterium]